MNKTMTKGERDDLLRLVRQRERVLKSSASQRAAVMLADFEKQISTIYTFDTDEVWKQAVEEARDAVRAAQKRVEDRCKELGIPDEFSPQISGVAWLERGQNAWKQRREELRRVAKAEISAVEQHARVEIERMSIEAQTEIVAHGLQSEAAQAFLAQLPTVEKLMPTLDLPKIEAKASLN
jgi:hypothetical protein